MKCKKKWPQCQVSKSPVYDRCDEYLSSCPLTLYLMLSTLLLCCGSPIYEQHIVAYVFFIILSLKEHAQDCNTITIAKRSKPRHYASFISIKLYTLPHSLNILSHSCEFNASTRNTNKILYPSSFPLCNMCRADTMTHYKNL